MRNVLADVLKNNNNQTKRDSVSKAGEANLIIGADILQPGGLNLRNDT